MPKFFSSLLKKFIPIFFLIFQFYFEIYAGGNVTKYLRPTDFIDSENKTVIEKTEKVTEFLEVSRESGLLRTPPP